MICSWPRKAPFLGCELLEQPCRGGDKLRMTPGYLTDNRVRPVMVTLTMHDPTPISARTQSQAFI